MNLKNSKLELKLEFGFSLNHTKTRKVKTVTNDQQKREKKNLIKLGD